MMQLNRNTGVVAVNIHSFILEVTAKNYSNLMTRHYEIMSAVKFRTCFLHLICFPNMICSFNKDRNWVTTNVSLHSSP